MPVTFEELVLIAEPRFLGVLRQQISAATRRLIKREIVSDLVRADEAQIERAAFPDRTRLRRTPARRGS